jgi:peptide-methionine (S)-S-oxide reductase
MGCFWGPEITFREVAGVTGVTVGYTGGHSENPSYRQVCSGKTGHAEAVRVEFDPESVSYETLLDVFWDNHDPTTRDRQGPDVGSQYRSAIFYHDEQQKKSAEASKAALDSSRGYAAPVVTEIQPAGPFYPAEDYHQRFLEKRGQAATGQ